jgi:hypothetical protein
MSMSSKETRRPDWILGNPVQTYRGKSGPVAWITKGTMLENSIRGRFRYIRMWKECGDGLKITGGACFMLD